MVIDVLLEEAESLLEKPDYDGCIKKYKEAIARMDTEDLNNYKTLAQIGYKLIRLYNINNKYDEAILLGYEGVEMLRRLTKAKHPDVRHKMFVQLYCEMSYSFIGA